MTTLPTFGYFRDAIKFTSDMLEKDSDLVEAPNWQSINIAKQGSLMHMREVFGLSWSVALPFANELELYQGDIEPNLPWADTAFEERVSGIPWNPGTAWESWPWARSAARFKPEVFSHSYAERYWPKLAGKQTDDEIRQHHAFMAHVHEGIRYQWGDLNDVVNHLYKDPLSRQAYLPLWFPEDTGVVHGERVPCTLGYHFLYRNGNMHITYYIRSCDFFRHFRDDIYMTLRLLLWVLDALRDHERQDGSGTLWADAKPGYFVFHCSSLHCFQNDWNNLFKDREVDDFHVAGV